MMRAAILVYGVLTIVLAFALAWSVGSFWGMAFAAAAAGMTYIFQALAEDAPDVDAVMAGLWIAIILAVLASFALSTFAGGF